MVITHYIEGYDNFLLFVNDIVKSCDGQTVYVYFSGTKQPDGESWCGDCVRAWPVISKELDKADPKFHLIYVEVGDREAWKNPSNGFRKDPKTKLMVIPTIIKWPGPQRLEGEQCEKPELVRMLFDDDD